MTRTFRNSCIAFAALLLTTLSFSQIPGGSAFVGVVYNLFHEEFGTDEEFFAQVDRDIPAIAGAGFTHVLVFPLGEWNEASRELEWKRTDYLIDKIEKAGLLFVPLMLKEEQCSHYFPIWAFDELPEIKAARMSNRGGSNNRENVDFLDPRVWPWVEAYFKAVVERYGKSPALAFYNIWNEPHYSSTAPHVVDRFRAWVKAKYGSLEVVNRVWGENYDQWEQLSPFLNDDWNSSMPGMDWALFRNELNGQILGELGAMLRRYDAKRAINANPVGTPFSGGQEFGGYAADNWVFTPYNEFNGVSYYPDGWDRSRWPQPHPLWQHNLNFNLFRNASGEKNYILTELYTNAKNGITLGGYVDPRKLDTLAWISFANDCKGIIYWKWRPFMRGRQSLGRGLTRVDGELAERGEAASALARVVKREGELLFQARPVRAEVAQIVDLATVFKVMQNPVEGRTRHLPLESHRGIFKALDQSSIPSDTLRADLGISLDQLRQYKIVFLPFQIVMRAELADTLARYVEQGGTLVADARSATIDEQDFAFVESPPGILRNVFGARRIDWIATPGWHEFEYRLDGGELNRIEGRYFRERLDVAAEAETLGVFAGSSEPALTRYRYGKGVAYLAATNVGGAVVEEGPQRGADKLIVELCAKAGVVPPVTLRGASSETVSVRLHQTSREDGRAVLYLISGSDAEQNGIALTPFSLVGRPGSARSLTSGAELRLHVGESGVEIPFTLPARGVEVIVLENPIQ